MNKIKIIIGSLLFSTLLYNCKSTTLPIIIDSSVKETISEEERKLKKAALDKANQANKHFQYKQLAKALELAKDSISTYPTGEGYFIYGIVLNQQGQLEKAKKSLEEAVQLSPENEKYLLSLAMLNSLLGYEKEAALNYNTLFKISSSNWIYRYKEAVSWKKQKDYDKALELLLSIPENEFLNLVELYSQIGDIYLKKKDYNQSKRYLEKAESLANNKTKWKIGSKSVQIAQFLEEGNQSMAQGNYTKAIDLYTRAIQMDPNNPSPYLFRSKAYMLNKDFVNSEKDLAKAYQLNDEFLPTYDSYSLFYYSKMDYQSSKEWARKGLVLFPKSYELWNRMGLVEWKIGNYNTAKVHFRKAIDINPNSYESHINLAYVLIDEQRYREAQKIFQNLIPKFPDKKQELDKAIRFSSQMEIISTGDEFVIKGNLKEALKNYEKAKSLGEDEPEVWNGFGRAYFAFANWKLSEESYKKSIQYNKENPEAWMGLVRIYSKTNRKKEEQEALNQLKLITKDNPDMYIVMARILEDKGDYVGAEKGYLEVRKKFPNYLPISIRLGNLYYKWAVLKNKEQDFNQALNYLRLAKKENPNLEGLKEAELKIQENKKFINNLPIIQEANNYYENQEYQKAIPLYEKAYKETGKATLYVKVAECYMRLGQVEKGISMLEAKERQTKSFEFKEAIYAFYLSKGETKKAEAGFLDILSKNSTSYYSLYNLGIIELERKNYDKAIDYFNRSLILHENFPAAHTAKGVAFYKKGNYERAKEEFELANKKDSNFEIAQFNLAVLYFNQNQNKDAKNILNQLIKNFPQFTDGYLLIANLEYKEKNFKKAEEYILQALKQERSPENLFAYYTILKEKKDFTKSNEIEKELRKNFPQSEYTKKLSNYKPDILNVQSFPIGGKWTLPPVVTTQGVIKYFGNSLVYSNWNGNTIQRIPINNQLNYISWDYYLIGISDSWIYIYNLETGSELKKIPYQKSNESIALAKIFFNGKDLNVGVLTSRIRNNKTHYVWKLWNHEGSRILQEWDSPLGTNVLYAMGDDFNNLLIVTNKGVVRNFQEFQSWGEILNLKEEKEQKDFSVDGLYQTTNGFIVQIQDQFWIVLFNDEFKLNSTFEVKFAKGEKLLVPMYETFVTISPERNDSKLYKFSIRDLNGKILEEKKIELNEKYYYYLNLSR